MNVSEKYRIKSGPLSPTIEDGNNGLFVIPRGNGLKQNPTTIAKYPFHHSPKPISHYKARVVNKINRLPFSSIPPQFL